MRNILKEHVNRIEYILMDIETYSGVVYNPLGITINFGHCKRSPSHLDSISKVADGRIVNDATAIVVENGKETTIKGTYLLTFENFVQINGTYYVEIEDREINPTVEFGPITEFIKVDNGYSTWYIGVGLCILMRAVKA